MRKRQFPAFSIALFALSALLAAYAVWAFVHSYRYISEARSSGQLVVSGNEFDIANFYMTNSIQYVVFAVLLFAAGWLARRPAAAADPAERGNNAAPPVAPARADEDEKLDDWFEELRKG